MKIAMIDPSLYTPPYDGALCKALLDAGHSVVLISRPTRDSDPPVGCDVEVLPLFYRRSERMRRRIGAGRLVSIAKVFEHLLDLPNVERQLRRIQPDVVHWQWPSLPSIDSLFVGRIAQRYPQVMTVHDANLFHRHGMLRATTVGWPAYLKAAHRLIAHLSSTKNKLQQMGVASAAIDVVPHGIFERDRGVETSVGGPQEALQCAFFGRLSLDKGLDVLADGLARLDPQVGKLLCVHIAGPVPERSDGVMRALNTLRSLPWVNLTLGFVPEEKLNELLRKSDVLIYPHREVDASGALMKGLAYDVAILASDIEAFKEVLGSCGGVEFFRSEDGAALAQALAGLAVNRSRVNSMKESIAALRRTEFSWPHVAKLTAEVYQRAIRATESS